MLQTSRRSLEQPPGFFSSRRTTHVNLYVHDLERTMDFYTGVLGLEEVYRTPLSGGGFVSNGNTHHDVGFITADGPAGRPRNAKPGQLNHFAFEQETEVALVAAYERALESGHRFLRTMDHDISHSVYGTDPDGNIYELYADVVGDWRDQRTGTVTKPKPDWTPGSTPPVGVPLYHEAPEIHRVGAARFHPWRTTSLTLAVTDLETSIEHYQRIAGLCLLSRGSDEQIAVLEGSVGIASLTLVQASATRPAGYHHVSIQVADPADLADSVENARTDGFPIAVDIAESGRRAVLVRDPDGFLTQFYSDEMNGPDFDAIHADLALYLL